MARVTSEWEVGETRTFYLRSYYAATAPPDRMACMPARPAPAAREIMPGADWQQQQQQQQGSLEGAAASVLEQAVMGEGEER